MALPVSVALMTEQDRQITEILSREASRLRSFIRRRVPNKDDAEDLLQEVFFEVLEALRIGEPVAQWSAWMYRVARNRIIDLLRKKRRWDFGDDAPADERDKTPLLERVPSPDAGPEEAYARAQLLEEIEDALGELPVEQRDVFIAHEIEGYSFKEIAAQTGVSANTLLSRKHYAVAHLRRRLGASTRNFSTKENETYESQSGSTGG